MSTLIVTILWVLTTALVTLDIPEMEQHAQVNILFIFPQIQTRYDVYQFVYEDFKNNTRLPSRIHMNDDIKDAKMCQILRQ